MLPKTAPSTHHSQRTETFMGTRPDALRMTQLTKAMDQPISLEPFVICTVNHREVTEKVFDLFGVPVHRSVNVMRTDQPLAGLSSNLLIAIDETLAEVRRPVPLMRATTERPNAVAAETTTLVGTKFPRTHDRATTVLTDAGIYRRMCEANNPYGDGGAASCIPAFLESTGQA